MRQRIALRCVKLAEHILETGDTVRDTAKIFKVSKSTVHKDVSERLKEIDSILFEATREILEFNLAERHIRGGAATKEKYAEQN